MRSRSITELLHEDARTARRWADRELHRLDALSFRLPQEGDAAKRDDEVRHLHANWLVWTRQVSVCVDAAGQGGRQPRVIRKLVEGPFGRPGTSLLP